MVFGRRLRYKNTKIRNRGDNDLDTTPIFL